MQEDNIERDGKSVYDLSNLVVTVMEAQNVEFERSSVTIMVKDQTYTTPFSESSIPQFNSQFRFTGGNIKDAISIILNSTDDDSHALNGQQPINELADQKIHDKWIVVKSGQNTANETKVHLQFQYIYSKAKLCKEAIENWKQHIQILSSKNEKNQVDLQQMYQGFDFLETIAQKPNYFSDIRPIDRIGPDVL